MSLLDYLTNKCEVTYLSDLKMTRKWAVIITQIDPESFPLKSWNETVQYLCRADITFETAKEAKEYLLKSSEA